MTDTSLVPSPVFSDVIDQRFFIEALGGAQQPVSYLDRFPDSVYTKALDSNLVTFLYALLGPVGVGLLREEYLEARLMIEEAGLSTTDLDSLYTHPLAFARLADETYDIDASASLLNAQERAQIIASDAAFRNRAIDFLKGIRAGGTTKGLALAAKSGLNHPVDLIENYRALYDRHSDLPLNLPFFGSTTNTAEIIILPREDVAVSAQQTITISGEPQSGWYTLTMPLGPNYRQMQVTVVSGSSIVTVPDSSLTPVGTFFTVGDTTIEFFQVGSILSPTSIQLVQPLAAGPTGANVGTPGQPASVSSTSGSHNAYVGNAQTTRLPYNATAAQVSTALSALPVIGKGNIVVTGGPLPDQPMYVRFTGSLADQTLPALQFNTSPDAVAGVGGTSAAPPLVAEMVDATTSPLAIVGNVVVDIAGTSADNQTVSLAPANEHAMRLALDQLRPVTSFVTTQAAAGTTRRLTVNTLAASGEQTEVLRYVTGQRSINWPSTDSLHWLEGGIEHEAPRPASDKQHHYQCFHNISNVYSYYEGALVDPNYETPTSLQTLANSYYDNHVGAFSPEQSLLFPYLSQYTDPNAQYLATNSVAPTTTPLVITKVVNGVGVINDEYPVDYVGLPGIQPLPTGTTFWSSTERGDGTDYLEIDLGSPQAVNYVYFEATNKPYVIWAAYDTLDMNPNRHFVPVSLLNPALASSVTSLSYEASAASPWTVVELNFANSLGGMIYTRFIRLGFERVPTDSPFITPGNTIPYSIEVRNLRVGRNLAGAVTAPNLHSGLVASETATTTRSGLYPSAFQYPGPLVYPFGGGGGTTSGVYPFSSIYPSSTILP